MKRYRSRVKEHLGVVDRRTPWRYVDWAKRHRGTFGRMKGLWRVFHILCEMLDMLDPANIRNVDGASALCVQSLKALLQVALDRGSWLTASLLLSVPEPMGRTEFGGDEDELEWIYDYRKALTAMRKAGAEAVAVESENEEAEEDNKKKGSKWWEDKKKKKEGEKKTEP